jgi:hypothetical protein
MADNQKETKRKYADALIEHLIHDAERAAGGAEMAAMLGDTDSRNELVAKRDRIYAEARRLGWEG